MLEIVDMVDVIRDYNSMKESIGVYMGVAQGKNWCRVEKKYRWHYDIFESIEEAMKKREEMEARGPAPYPEMYDERKMFHYTIRGGLVALWRAKDGYLLEERELIMYQAICRSAMEATVHHEVTGYQCYCQLCDQERITDPG